jgi:hypothetical protein
MVSLRAMDLWDWTPFKHHIPLSPLPAVPVKLFSNFRKIRTLTKDVEVIARSLLTSQVREMQPPQLPLQSSISSSCCNPF